MKERNDTPSAHWLTRSTAATLATLLFWTPLAPPLVHAEDGEPAAPARSSVSDVVGLALDDEARAQFEFIESDGVSSVEVPGLETRDIEELTPSEERDPEIRPLSLPGVEARTAVTPQAISLPDAEGSVQGMGESFSPQLSSGTASFSVPIAVAPGRAGVQPSLSLTYSSARGNGPVGFGWSMEIPFISRQTDRGLPRYVDRPAWHPEEDRFIYNGGQELVPVDSAAIAAVDQLAADGAIAAAVPSDVVGWQQYRARVEGGFMRFFRSPDSSRWVVQGRDGARFDFGLLSSGKAPIEAVNASVNALEADPEGTPSARRVERWCLTRMSDAHGSAVYYRYRQDRGRAYLEDIHYVSPASCGEGATPEARRDCTAPLSGYGARVGFVYESREDVFSSYATGWKIETGLRLRRIEVTAWHETGRTLVRRYHLRYEPSSFHSLLASLQLEGRPEAPVASLGVSAGRADVSESALGDGIVGPLLPAMRFGYSTMPTSGDVVAGFGGLDATVHDVASSPPHSVDEDKADLFDVNSDGLPDLIVTDPARYRTPSGNPAVGVFFNGFSGSAATPAGATAIFSGAVPMGLAGGLTEAFSLANPNVVPMDIDGDGRSDLLHMPRIRTYGWFTPTRNVDATAAAVSPAQQGWKWTFAQTQLPEDDTDPRIDLTRDSERLEITDVNNDHLIDVVRTTGTSMQTWLNLGWLPGGDGRFGTFRYVDGEPVLSTRPIESCLLHAGVPLDFEDPEVRLADMNGDGVLDIVRVRRGAVSYWPGRGEGSWGDGPRRCDAVAGAGEGREIVMSTPPAELNVELAGMSLSDVNGDGASDVVQVRFDGVDVWFNRAGRGFTRRVTAHGTPPTPDFAPRVRYADIDGSGTTDIVWGAAGRWQYVDLAGGRRPRLLVRVENGLGARTDIEYGSSAEDYVEDLADAHGCTSCADRFTWGRVDGEPSARLLELSGRRAWRSAGSPVISTVVRRVRTSDRMDVDALRLPAQVTEARFGYHDGYYEGIEQEFRGFGAADSETVGDWNHPTSLTRTFFHQGRRPQSIADDRLADNPDEALKGREYLTESFDEAGVYLSSAHATMTLRRLLEGLDGRWVQYAYVSEANELRYDTTVWAPSAATISLNDVVRQDLVSGAFAARGTTTRALRVRGMNLARIRTTYDEVDTLGQVRSQTAHGHVTLAADLGDEPITTRTEPLLLDGARWLWRTGRTWVQGTDGVRLHESVSTYVPETGDLAVATQLVSSPRTYDFSDEAGRGEGDAPALAQTDDDVIASTRHDVWGNALASCIGTDISSLALGSLSTLPAGCLRYRRVSYDALFSQLAEHETSHVSVSGPVTVLETGGAWDRGLGAVLTATDPNGLVTRVEYDGLGRLVAVAPPNVDGCSGTHPTVRIAYELTSDGATMPVSRVITTTELDCDGALGEDDGSLVSIAYIDGLARSRAALATGDVLGQWIRSGLTTLDAKGTVRRSYQPDFFTGAAVDMRAVLTQPRTRGMGSGFPAFASDDIPYTVTRYDAFGRTIGQHAEDGSYTSTSYHALSTDVCDALDNDATSGFFGTCTTARSDGHGRVIDQILRTYDVDTGTPERHRLWSYYRADGSVRDLVRARTTDENVRPSLSSLPSPHVRRSFHYDTQGRRIGTDDSDTDSRRAGLPASRSTWRYLFNGAGDIAAVRDPRGCGQNFYYDLGGRLLGEQYVGCDEAMPSASEQPVGTVPAGSISTARTTAAEEVDVVYQYDAAPSWASPPTSSGGTLGRATGIADRGQRSAIAYDARGNAVWTARQMAVISDAPPLVSGPSRPNGDDRPSWIEDEAPTGPVVFDAAHTYVRTGRFDHAGRGVAIALPRDETWTSGAEEAPAIGGMLRFGRRGFPASASVTIDCDPVATSCASMTERPVISSIEYERDGMPRRTVWGDAVLGREPSESTTTYDVRRRPIRLRTTRDADPMAAPGELAGVSVVADQELRWDAASNLVETLDHRDGAEWPAGHLPQSTFVMHDALYRVTGAAFSYSQDDGDRTTADDATDWRATQQAIREAGADPMDVEPAEMLGELPDSRIVDLDWRWDWLGNTTSWRDDADAFYERSIGSVQNGADVPSADLRPSALYISSNIATPIDTNHSGWLELEYGDGGNVTSMTVHGQCRDAVAATCADDDTLGPSARATALRAACECRDEQYYEYRWDELNRLAEARRWDRKDGAPDWTIKVRQRYRYDASNVRTIKQTFEPTDEDGEGAPGQLSERIALYVYPGDYEVRGLERDEEGYVARAVGHVETQYLIAGARLVWRDVAGDDIDAARHRRLTAPLIDLIQTTTATLDLLTGDLVEASTYYPNGARETLLADADDPSATDPAGFTGKEGDEEVGVTYFGERYLISRIGRWASPDPLHVHQAGGGESLNSYHYVSGNTMQTRDPIGLCGRPGEEACTGQSSAGMAAGRATAPDRGVQEQIQEQDRARDEARDQPRQPWSVERLFWTTIKPDPVAGNLINHYMNGSGSAYSLKRSEMAHISPTLSLTRSGRDQEGPTEFESLRSSLIEIGGGRLDDVTIDVQHQSSAAGTLGAFTVRFTGALEVTEDGEWTFDGEAEFIDTYNFDPRAWGVREAGPEIQTRIAAELMAGRGFAVTSERVRVTQTSRDPSDVAVWDNRDPFANPGNAARADSGGEGEAAALPSSPDVEHAVDE